MKKQWEPVDKEFFAEFIKLHNEFCCERKTQNDFNNFVVSNKERFNNPDYLQIFAENVTLFHPEFYKQNFEMCKVFYDFMQANPEWGGLPFSLRTSIRLGVFEDEFKEVLEEAECR